MLCRHASYGVRRLYDRGLAEIGKSRGTIAFGSRGAAGFGSGPQNQAADYVPEFDVWQMHKGFHNVTPERKMFPGGLHHGIVDSLYP